MVEVSALGLTRTPLLGRFTTTPPRHNEPHGIRRAVVSSWFKAQTKAVEGGNEKRPGPATSKRESRPLPAGRLAGAQSAMEIVQLTMATTVPAL